MEEIRFAAPDCGDSEVGAVMDAIQSGWIVGGSRLATLEQLFADHCERDFAVGVTSWTTGAFLVLHAWGIGPGDEVIVPSYSFIATANVVRHVGATPVFADIDPATWNLDPEDVRRKITPRTRAIIPVDQIGLPCDIHAFGQIAEEHGLHVLQDAACSLGSHIGGRPVGADAEVAVFSMHARKILTTGEGGMIVTSDGDLAEKLRLLRGQGMTLSDHERHSDKPTRFESYPIVGFNFRLTDIQAAMGVAQFARFPEILETRRRLGDRYMAAFAQHPHIRLPQIAPDAEANWQSFMIGLSADSPVDQIAFMDGLFEYAIPTRRSIMASHLEPAYADQGAQLPHTEHAFAHNVLLPMHNNLTHEQQDFVIASVKAVLGEKSAS